MDKLLKWSEVFLWGSVPNKSEANLSREFVSQGFMRVLHFPCASVHYTYSKLLQLSYLIPINTIDWSETTLKPPA